MPDYCTAPTFDETGRPKGICLQAAPKLRDGNPVCEFHFTAELTTCGTCGRQIDHCTCNREPEGVTSGA